MRLIPAHAGKTVSVVGPRWGAGAHPRSRGENSGVTAVGVAAAGSSPLTRGKRVAMALDPDARGLIPAHAGKTVMASCIGRARGAHPRSRGENSRRACK